MSSIINGYIVFALIITAAYFVGLLSFVADHEENKCDMTFMFEYPQFVRVFNEIDDKYPKYGLYAYSEGRMTEKTRNMYFDGIPVLFVPGNGGSHRQVRSLASVALRKAYNSRTPFHFDYFSIDLNAELNGLNGALLVEQLDYVNSSIYTILEMYRGRRNAPKSVILVGHSMGGIIARRFVADLPQDSELVPVVLTLATPHRRPPLMLDHYFYEFYRGIQVNGSTSSNTTFVSITGGFADFLVAPFLTNLLGQDSLNVVSTHIPRSWLMADHLCILWCRQTVLVLNRALFDLIDRKTNQISADPVNRKSVFHHHLVHHNGVSTHLRTQYDLKANIRNQGEWTEPFGRQFTIHPPRHCSTTHFYMVRLVNQSQHEALTVVALNLKTVDWAYVCGAHLPRGNSRVCEEFVHLTHLSEIAPSAKYKRRSLQINMHDLMRNKSEFTHVVVRVLPTDEQVILYFDVYNVAERRIQVNLPNLYKFKRKVLIEETAENAVHYELVLPELQQVMQSYQLFVDAKKCSHEFRHATASLVVPWGHQDQHKYFVNDSRPLDVRLYEPRPHWATGRSAKIKLVLDPNCRYRISIRSSLLGTLSQIARFYTPLLIVNIAAVILMALSTQLKNVEANWSFTLFFDAVKDGAKPYYILTSVKLGSRFLSSKSFLKYLPAPDWVITSQDGTDFFLLPLLLYICSVGIVWLLAVVLFVSLVTCETTLHKVVVKFLTRTSTFISSWSEYVMTALHKLPCVFAAALVCLCLTTTGSLALCVGMIFYFLRLTQLSQDYAEDLVWNCIKTIVGKVRKGKPQTDKIVEPSSSECKEQEPSSSKTESKEERKELDNKCREEKESGMKDAKEKESDKKDGNTTDDDSNKKTSARDIMFFHVTMFMLWCLVTIINIPSLLTWAHNFKYNTTLEPDPSFHSGLMLSFCALPLWQLELPKIDRKFYSWIGHLISALAVVSLVYAPVSLFRLNYTITAAIVVVIAHQLVSPRRTYSVKTTRQMGMPPWYETLKAKLE